MSAERRARDKKIKTAWLVLCLAALAVSCLVFACPAPAGEEASFSITIGSGGGRAIDYLLWEPETKIAELVHTITLTNGPAPDVLREDVKAGKTVQFSIEPGHWDITVKAYLIVEGEKILKAEGFKPVDLKPGHNGAIIIDMHKPDGEVTLVSIAVTKLPEKTHYNLGEELDTTGMVVTATYSDGSTAEVTDYTLSGYEKDQTGNHAVIVTYNGKTAEFEVNVINPKLPTAAIPTASPAGGEVAVNTAITLTTATEGAKIYYTQDDTVPNAASALYSDNNKPVITSNKLILKAYAVKDEMNDSDILTVEYILSALINAATPTITNPQDIEIIKGETAALSVTVSDLTDGGALSYQWYSGNSSTNNTGGTPIEGANSISYNFITTAATTLGNYYYYCAVTNTNTNVNGVQTATTTSAVATVIVYGAGTGSYGDPFIVYDVATLERVGKEQGGWLLNAYYKQIRDIDLSSDVDDNWTPIGSEGAPFTGSYDGNDHTINNLKFNYNRGLFGCTGSTAVVKKIGIKNCNGNPVSGVIGGVVGTNGGTVQYCYSTLIVPLTEGTLGGVVGENIAGGKVQNCYFTGYIHGSYNVGGIVGNNYGTVENCYTTGKVSGSANVGGIVGNNYDGIVQNCYTTGDVSAGNNVGGVVGECCSTVKNCYATGEVSGANNVGGVAGSLYGSRVENCYATGKVSGDGDYGNVGGVVGAIGEGGWVYNCYATGDVSGQSAVGGVVGITSGSVENCYATGNVSATDELIGGVAGQITYGALINCVALNPNISDRSSVGRVVGQKNTDPLITLANNYGRSNMKKGGNPFTWSYTTSDGLDGADITATQWGVLSWWVIASGVAWDFDEVWEWGGNLPILRNMPGRTQDPAVRSIP